jgi:hypothetical protein
MDAMSCGAVVLGSATSPVKEMIRDGENGLLADFFKPEEFAHKAVEVLKDPGAFRQLGRAAEQMIVEKYSLEAVLPQMLQLYEDAKKIPIPYADVAPRPKPPPPDAQAQQPRPKPAFRPMQQAKPRSPFRG